MRRFQDQPIRRKVRGVILAVFAVSVVLAGIGVLVHQSIAFRKRAETDLRAQAGLLALVLDSPVAWGQNAEAVAALERLRANSEVASAWVFELPDRARVFAQSPPGATIPDFLLPLEEGATFVDGELWLVKDLRLAGSGPFATLVLHSRLEVLRQERTHSLLILSGVILAVLIPTFAIAATLTRSLIGPIASLAHTVHAITERMDPRLRAPSLSNDEIGRLAADFNRMLDALERKDAALVAGERNYREMFDASNDPIFLHDSATGRILDANRAAVVRYGYSREELLLLSVGSLSAGDPPWTQDGAADQLRRAVEEGPQVFEWLARPRRGAAFWVEVALRSTEIGGQGRVLAVVRDISERKRAQEALRESEERFRSLVEEAGALPVQGYDRSRRVFFWNQASVNLYGYSREEALGRPIEELVVPPEHRAAFVERIRAWIELGIPIAPGEEERRHRDRLPVPVYASHVLLRNRHGEPEFFEVDVDLRERRHAAAEQEALRAQLHQAQKMEAVGQLAGGVAHDFNNLLQIITGFTGMAAAQLPPDSPAARDLREVVEAGDRAKRLVHQLLTFSRRQTIHPEPLDLNEVVGGFLTLLGRLIGEHIHLQFVRAPAPCRVHADRGQLEQVLMNLCVNARDAMPGGGTLTLTVDAVDLAADASRSPERITPGRYARLRVADTGCGIPRESQERLFEPFFTTKAPGKGTGLGLATVYGIIRKHGGFVQVASTPGLGATFEVCLPELLEFPGSSTSGAKDLAPPSQGGSETILIAEDEESVRDLVRKVLASSGYRVLTASDGQEALEVIREHGAGVDLALLDLVMPRMGGRATAEALRSLLPKLRILFASGYDPDVGLGMGSPGPDWPFVQKPFSPGELLRRVREALDQDPAGP